MRSSLPNITIERQLHYAEKGEGGGVDIREPSTALLGISSVDRYRAGLTTGKVNPQDPNNVLTSPYDFQITTPSQNLMTGFFTRLAVSEVQFRWTIPTITARNNKIYINIAPYTNTLVTNVAHATSTTTFTMSATTGYLAGQTIVATGFTTVNGVPINGIYTVASVTGTTLVCNDPNSLPDFTTTAYTGAVVVRQLVTIPSGWYDIYNQDVTTVSQAGNLAFQLQTAVRTAGTPITALVNAFTCRYALQYQGVANAGTPVPTATPYNAFVSDNSGSIGSSTFYWSPYYAPTRPNAVGLFDMMAWNNTSALWISQWGSPNASYLSTPFVDIVCDGLTYNQSLKDSDTGDLARTVLCRVFLTPDAFTGNMANLGSAPILLHRSFPFPKQIKWNANQPIGNLRFQVYDSQGYLLSTYEGVSGVTNTNPPTYYDSDMGDFSMTLLVSEV
jgi:hypothetical protein